MNNLKLCSEWSLNVDFHSTADEHEVLLLSAFDIERNRLFFSSSANFIYTLQISSPQNEGAWRKNFIPAEAKPIDLEPGDFITCMDYIMEKEALVLGTSNGLLLLHSADTNVTEVVGRVEGGVKCVSLSPDGDLLGVITGFREILVMTQDWDVLHENSLDDGVDVLSGDPTFPAESPFQCSISWRGDGKYFATISQVHTSVSVFKKLKVWDRDSGELHATSEPKALNEAVLEWMPSGAKIATVNDRKAEDKCPLVSFFERNGLERSSFSINGPKDATVESLKWNCSSELLAAVVRCEGYDLVKIWFFSNNHWYLKQEVRYLRKDGVRVIWDPTKPLQLISWTLAGQVTVFNFVWVTGVMENSLALVVDDAKILATPFSLSLMPPPMYSFNLNFPAAIRNMSFYSNNGRNYVAVFSSDGGLNVAELPAPEFWEELEGKQIDVEAAYSEKALGSIVHLVWLDTNILLGVSHFGFSHSNCAMQPALVKAESCGFYLQEISLVCSEDHDPNLGAFSGWHAEVSNHIPLEGSVISIASNPVKKGSAFIQFDGGKVLEYTSKLGIPNESLKPDVSFSLSCPWMCVVHVSDIVQLKPMVFGLSDTGMLHANGRILCTNCRSFSFYSNSADQSITHLILMTKQDLLFVVDISDILYENLEERYMNFTVTNTQRREKNKCCINVWERGAGIVGVLHGDEAAVILQTTRGNLECIYPRKLVLASIINALAQRRFKDALLMVRRQRIDFNIIVDHFGLQSFLHHAEEFVRQVDNLSYITEFICSVRDGNIVETLYRDYISSPNVKGDNVVEATIGTYDADSKVSSVLSAVRMALLDQFPESPARELCILTTLARSDPPALEEALRRIKVIRDLELSNIDDPQRKTYPSAEESLKHLLWLSDTDAVYETALGLYDLNLSAIVALNAQRDPKEFLPFLQELQQMPVLLMQYNIDLRLHRYEKALKHIISAGDAYYLDSLNLMKKNPQLFPLGLRLITEPGKRMHVLESWGDHFYDEKCFEDAATTYLCCACLDKALKAHRASGNWRGALTVSGLLNLGREEITKVAHELCEELQALGKPGEAAKIALEYCDDIKNGVSLLISARDWEEALRIAFLHQREDLVMEIKNASEDCASMLIGEYEEGLEKVGKYLARYLAVRQRRLLLAAKLQSEELSFDNIDDDTSSEASSNFSGMSAYTTGTKKSSAASVSSKASKARGIRRQRNRGKIRAGSPDEEIALVEHLKGMSLSTGSQQEVKSLLSVIVMLGKEESARKLQRAVENFQLSQIAAVKLTEDTTSSNNIDESAHTLERYIQKVRCDSQQLEVFSWRSKVLNSS